MQHWVESVRQAHGVVYDMASDCRELMGDRTMGYCKICGQQANGRCMGCHREICQMHQPTWTWGWAPAEDKVAPFYGQRPQLRVSGSVTCNDCAHTSDSAVYAKLGQDLQGRGEHVAVAWIITLRLLEGGIQGKPRPAITVAQHARLEGIGTRPLLGWVIEALVATREPEVLSLHTSTAVPARAGGLFRAAVPAHKRIDLLCSVAGWMIAYEDTNEYSNRGSLLIRPDGTATNLRYTTERSDGRLVLRPLGSGEPADVLRSKLQGRGMAASALEWHCDGCKISAATTIASRVIGNRRATL